MEMQDASDKGSESPGVASSEESHVTEAKKTCADCGTTKTPLWRGGPAGPKSLCNACGIRSRKKRRDILGINKKPAEDKRRKKINRSPSNDSNDDRFGDSLKQKLLDLLGKEVMMQKRSVSSSSSSSSSTSSLQRQRKKLGEEEQAAVLLMALSYGSVYA